MDMMIDGSPYEFLQGLLEPHKENPWLHKACDSGKGIMSITGCMRGCQQGLAACENVAEWGKSDMQMACQDFKGASKKNGMDVCKSCAYAAATEMCKMVVQHHMAPDDVVRPVRVARPPPRGGPALARNLTPAPRR